jgi:hypothetical protein
MKESSLLGVAGLSCYLPHFLTSAFSSTLPRPSFFLFTGPILLEDYQLVEKLANVSKNRHP